MTICMNPYCKTPDCPGCADKSISLVVNVCREDNPADVDEAYGAGTYARLFLQDESE